MQYISVAFAALATAVAASELHVEEHQASPTSINTISILAVLATAIPSSLLDEALTNPAAVSSVVSSEFAAKQTPAWFSALPGDVQSYLVPATTIAQAPGVFLSALPSEATFLTIPTPGIGSASNTTRAVPSSAASYRGANGNSTLGVAGGATGSGGGTRVSILALPTSANGSSHATKGGSSPVSATSTASGTATSTGGASLPTGLISLGMGGIVGVCAVLAL